MNGLVQELTGFWKDKEYFKTMLNIAVPVMLSNFIVSFLNMVDTVMVGKLGEAEIAAVGIANQYFFFFTMFLIGLSAGCSVFISQFWGKRDIQNIKRITGIGLISTVIVSLIFIFFGYLNPRQVLALFNNDPVVLALGTRYLKIVLVSYLFTGITFIYSFVLRSVGQAVMPMVISGLALIINIFFNYCFIFGKLGAPALGVEGAAIATVIARVTETVILVFNIYLQKGALAATLKELTDFNGGIFLKAFQTILPVILNDMCWGLASLVYVAVYGRMGIQAVATIQICNTVNNLFMVVIFGLSSAAAVMVGNSIGAGEEWQGKKYAERFCLLSIAVGILLGILLALFTPLILNLFNVSQEVRRNSEIILYTISVVFFIRVLSIMLIVGILRGGGDATRAFLIEGFTMWFIGVPLTILGAFVFKFPVYLVYALSVLEEIVKCILGFLRLKSGQWINNVTRSMT
ncbi:MAG: MATE family efflux transporter [Clostridia bacterium]|nr:MATE family efflux transporter [Clostridia bacterium]